MAELISIVIHSVVAHYKDIYL